MDVHATLEAACGADQLFALVDDLGQYPAWMDLVHGVQPAGISDGGVPPAWQVELRARVGPFARSKRLRMQRSLHDTVQHRVMFERAETDARSHSPWVLRADVNETADGSTLHVHLHYGGALWTGGVLERVLGDQIRSGRERLQALVRSTH